MANTFQFSSNSTFDDELDRYAEAAETEQSSIGLNPNVVKKRVYNQETNTTDLFASISGGFVKIGEEPLSALADLERYDQSLRSRGVTPTANDFYAAGFDDAVISESGILEPSALTVMPVDGPPNDARFAEFQSIMGTADAGPTMADYEAAGFTPDEVSTFQTRAFEATMPADAMVPTPLNQDQIDQYVKEEDSEYVSRQPGLPEIAVTQAANIVSEVGKGLARGIIVNPANFVKDFFGLYDPLALQFFHPQTGEFDPKILFMSREEKAALDEKMAAGEMPYAASLDEIIASDPETLVAGLAGGIAQFVGAYVGLGKLFRMNKGLVASAGRGAAADFLAFSGDEGRLTDVLVQMGVSDAYIPDFFKTDPNDPDYIGRFKTALEGAALGAMVEIIGPLFRAIKNGDMSPKAVSQLLTDGRQKAQRFMVQQIDGAEQRVANNSGTLYSNPVAPLVDQALVAAKGFFTTQVPDVNAFVVLASKGKLQQARTLNQDILDISKKKMSGTVLNINTADDKTSMMYETGKLTQQLKDKGLFIDDDRMGTIYVGTTQENLNAIKNAKTPAEIGKLSGYSDADIAAFYLKRRGGNKDLAFQEYQSDTANLAAPQSLDAQVEAARLAYEGKPNDAALKKEYFDLRTQRDAMPIAEVQAPTKDTPGIIAFSGSGKDFDQFSLKYINTGEGAQAYGDGLYFSDSESIATFYKNAVRQTQNLREGYDVSYKGKKFKNLGDTADAEAQGLEYGAISSIIDNLNRVTTMGTKELPQQELLKLAKENLIKSKEAEKLRFEKDYGDSEDLSKRIIESFDDEIKAIDAINVDDLSFSEGKTYKVNLEVKPNELLNYDKTFDEQPPFVQKAILKALNEITIDDAYNIGIDLFSPPYNGNEKMAIRDAQKLMLNNFNTARFLNDWAAIRGSRDAGEKLLDKHGVKGITYKANRGSGNAAEGGPNNYVIFDDRLIQILEKYGIVGPVALSVLTAEGGKGEGKTNGY